MRNLSHLMCSNVSVPKSGDCDVHLAVDSDTGRIYFNTETDLIGVDPAFHEETFSIGLEELSDHAIQVTGIQFLQGEESLCVCSQEGDLLVVNVHSKTIDNVGSVESGLTAMCWSPDQELLLLLTSHDTVIAMTREFVPIAEVSVHAKEFGEGQFINVGWGKKETQFHGSEGKGAAMKKEETIQTALPWDDHKSRIVWRGDGQFFGVHLIDPERGNRLFRVWNRECVLQYTSEYMAGLESAFAWRPSGNLLVSSQRKPHQHDIVFFEKNGLQHGEFTLPFDKDAMKVKHLEWSSDSSVLLVWLAPLKKDSCINASSDQVLLWTVSNYHWYLKQSLLFASDKTPVCVQWDAEGSHKLHIICKDGTYKQYVFMKSICHSNSSLSYKIQGQQESTSTVAVIDGSMMPLWTCEFLSV